MTNLRTGKLLHAALLVSDLDRARRFYGEALGLKEKPRHDFDFPGAWYDLGECELHLMVTSEPLPPATERPRRDFHVAFSIEDYEATRRSLEEAGIEFREGRSGLAQLFVRDPDGNLIELQSPRPSAIRHQGRYSTTDNTDNTENI
ncbi:MAG: VOC family protein [Blastocatellia bacterium]|nr:VOC family protein [Blastocatellia bacterium]